MLRFSANLSMLFKEVALPERFAAAKAAGFEAVEIQFPYDTPIDVLAKAKTAAHIPIDLVNLPAGDFAAGLRGIAGVPGREKEFRAAIETGGRLAEILGVHKVNVLAGIKPEGADEKRCLATLVENLRLAASTLQRTGVRVLIEPINKHDIPGFLVNTTAEAAAIVARVNHPNLSVQADLYHMARMGEAHGAALAALGAKLGHVQFADAPGRNEPGTGTLDFAALFAAVEATGYKGFVAAEYTPSKPTAETLGWLARQRKSV
jgi:hydroxypyruvate isomerase